MPRDLVVGNGKLLINFDSGLAMRDLYYPHVGMLNHISGHRNSIGIWVDGHFRWLDEPGWERNLSYETDTLVTSCSVYNRDLQVEMHIEDAVHFRRDVYLKRIVVTNHVDRIREIRIFFTHDFCIDQTDIGDTALYDPTADAVLHYKRDKCFLVSGRTSRGGIYQYATGTKRFGGAEGTWRDAEDGRLEGNPIAQGSVDSTVSFKFDVAPGDSELLQYWIAVSHDFESARTLHAWTESEGVEKLLTETRAYWRAWVNKREWQFGDLGEEITSLFKQSLLIIRTQIDRDGAILAANDTDILQFNRDHYSYMWPRDGALVAYALDRAGYPELTEAFYDFCRRVLAPGGFLWHKYNPDGSVGSSWHPWVRDGEVQLPIQEDETALPLFALWHRFEREHNLEFMEPLYESFIKPCADFMVSYRDSHTHLPRSSYDLWEERRGVFTFTCAAVWAGLRAASRFASLFGQRRQAQRYHQAAAEVKEAIGEHLYDTDLGRFLRGLYIGKDGEVVKDKTLESSVFGLFEFGVVSAEDPRMVRTMEAIADGLWVKTPIGGIARYTGDYYHHVSSDFARIPGNPWIICTLWLAKWYIERARTPEAMEPAHELLQWVCRRALSTGVLPEQVHPETGSPLSVAPLTWSHSTFVMTVLRYCEKQNVLRDRQPASAHLHMN